jgi:hypothetical protein
MVAWPSNRLQQVSWGLVQPLYSFITGDGLFLTASGSAVVLFMLLYHGVPVSLVFLLERFVIVVWRYGKILRWYRGLLFGITSMILVRGAYLQWGILGFESFALPIQILLVIVALTVFVGVCGHYFKEVSLLFIYLGIGSVAFTVAFVVQANATGKLLGDDSSYQMLEE